MAIKYSISWAITVYGSNLLGTLMGWCWALLPVFKLQIYLKEIRERLPPPCLPLWIHYDCIPLVHCKLYLDLWLCSTLFSFIPTLFIVLTFITLTTCPLNIHPLRQNSLYTLGLSRMLGYLLQNSSQQLLQLKYFLVIFVIMSSNQTLMWLVTKIMYTSIAARNRGKMNVNCQIMAYQWA